MKRTKSRYSSLEGREGRAAAGGLMNDVQFGAGNYIYFNSLTAGHLGRAQFL